MRKKAHSRNYFLETAVAKKETFPIIRAEIGVINWVSIEQRVWAISCMALGEKGRGVFVFGDVDKLPARLGKVGENRESTILAIGTQRGNSLEKYLRVFKKLRRVYWTRSTAPERLNFENTRATFSFSVSQYGIADNFLMRMSVTPIDQTARHVVTVSSNPFYSST